MVRPNVSTKISTYHLMTLLQKVCVYTDLFSRVNASHGFHCTLSQRCAKGRRVLLELRSFKSTILIPANVGIAWQVRGDSPTTNVMLDGRQIHNKQLSWFRAVSPEQTLC